MQRGISSLGFGYKAGLVFSGGNRFEVGLGFGLVFRSLHAPNP